MKRFLLFFIVLLIAISVSVSAEKLSVNTPQDVVKEQIDLFCETLGVSSFYDTYYQNKDTYPYFLIIYTPEIGHNVAGGMGGGYNVDRSHTFYFVQSKSLINIGCDSYTSFYNYYFKPSDSLFYYWDFSTLSIIQSSSNLNLWPPDNSVIILFQNTKYYCKKDGSVYLHDDLIYHRDNDYFNYLTNCDVVFNDIKFGALNSTVFFYPPTYKLKTLLQKNPSLITPVSLAVSKNSSMILSTALMIFSIILLIGLIPRVIRFFSK